MTRGRVRSGYMLRRDMAMVDRMDARAKADPDSVARDIDMVAFRHFCSVVGTLNAIRDDQRDELGEGAYRQMCAVRASRPSRVSSARPPAVRISA